MLTDLETNFARANNQKQSQIVTTPVQFWLSCCHLHIKIHIFFCGGLFSATFYQEATGHLQWPSFCSVVSRVSL
jgi:hypothetical protein